jgi:hypothetical protein
VGVPNDPTVDEGAQTGGAIQERIAESVADDPAAPSELLDQCLFDATRESEVITKGPAIVGIGACDATQFIYVGSWAGAANDVPAAPVEVLDKRL